MLKNDSRKVLEGDTFIALKGIEKDGHDYIEEAIKNGASKVIIEYGDYSVPALIVESTKTYLDNYLNGYLPKIKIIGVTGTNGKTTTCYLIWKIFKILNIKSAYIGTLGFYLNEKVRDLDNTTPGSLELYELLIEAYNNEFEYVVMEASSQALDQGRLDFLEFDYAIFTNLTQDHLDYHLTMENYVEAKRKLFYKLKDNGIGIINKDDPCSAYFEMGNYVTYGYSESDYQIEGENLNFKINEEEYEMNLLGKYNIYNMSAVICLLYQLGYNNNDLKATISLCDSPEGRMDLIKKGDNKIIIDYAHTPDAMANILDCVKEIEHGRIITIIGCGGNRDKMKRPIMGDIATKKSDYVIFTSDNPRNEDPDQILLEIVKELDTTNYEIESNRENAIKKGIQFLMKNDILLVLGKGHEKSQIIKGEKILFDDKKVVLENI